MKADGKRREEKKKMIYDANVSNIFGAQYGALYQLRNDLLLLRNLWKEQENCSLFIVMASSWRRNYNNRLIYVPSSQFDE